MTDATDGFVRFLQEIAESGDRASLATLRQGFTNPLRALPYVAPFLASSDGRQREDNLILLATLFASHREHGQQSLARAMHLVMIATGSGSIEPRFRALLDCSREDLPSHLRHAVSLVASQSLPIDFDDLLQAIRHWSHDDRFIQRRWARDFWSSQQEAPDSSTQPLQTPATAQE